MGRRFTDLSGQRFGRLLVTPEIHMTPNGRAQICICDCGNKTFSQASPLLLGRKRSCGCLAVDNFKKRSTTHGLASEFRTKLPSEYKVWSSMKARCADKTLARYGGRGIYVCRRWRTSFLYFLEDMGKRPSNQHTLERIDNDGPYRKDNCRWATPKDQARNRRTTRIVVYQGREMSLAEACELSGVNYDAAKYRINNGIPLDKPRNKNARDYRNGRA